MSCCFDEDEHSDCLPAWRVTTAAIVTSSETDFRSAISPLTLLVDVLNTYYVELSSKLMRNSSVPIAGQMYADRRSNLLRENAEKPLSLTYNIRLFNCDY